MCYVLWFRRHYKSQREKARGNNDLSYVPSKGKEEIKSGTSGCGSFVVPYFQPATSTDRLHLYITNTVVHALIKPEKQQGNTSVLVHHGQQEHCNTCPYQTWKTTGQYFCSCTAQTLQRTPPSNLNNNRKYFSPCTSWTARTLRSTSDLSWTWKTTGQCFSHSGGTDITNTAKQAPTRCEQEATSVFHITNSMNTAVHTPTSPERQQENVHVLQWLRQYVNWCFTPSQPVQLYQGDWLRQQKRQTKHSKISHHITNSMNTAVHTPTSPERQQENVHVLQWLRQYVNWCFTPSQPVQLYQGDWLRQQKRQTKHSKISHSQMLYQFQNMFRTGDPVWPNFPMVTIFKGTIQNPPPPSPSPQ